ncbi:MAG: leucine--tRNA ligase [Bacteroidales bacterium]|nr:leucine--tRNA ligase [Bacteroidales bacterium]
METLEWTDALKEIQKNWIGKSVGAELQFEISHSPTLSKGEGATPGYQTANSVHWEHNKENARQNRKNQTSAEEALWQELRAKKTGYQIRRQHVTGNFIVDFVCLVKKVIIEVDGEIHNFQKEEDALRTQALNEYGFEVIRFSNHDVLKDSKSIAQKIKTHLDQKVLSFGEDLGEALDKASIKVFTTRPDTIYGVSFIVLAPESDLAVQLTTYEQKEAVDAYIKATKKRSERDRMSDVKTVTGVFSGSYAIHPLTGQELPIWIADYVLAGYGTGAVMAVPAHDSRDFAFAKHFNLPIVQVVNKQGESPSDPATWSESYDSKEGVCINSGIIDGLEVKEAQAKIIAHFEAEGIGKKQINYRLRDAIFSRQRYWGEPFPVYYKDGLPYTLEEDQLPLELPEVDKFLPTEDGQPPLGRAENWNSPDGYPLELSTMPGFAGSSAYYLRYMDPKNDQALVSKEANAYWQDVDLYIGGTEHATGHLIYSRFWNKFLYDINAVTKDEPFKKLINQGMIQGRSNFVYRITGSNQFVSKGIKDQYPTDEIHVDVNIVSNDILDTEAFKQWRPEFKDAEFILEDDKYHCGYAVEKMSKSMFNVVNPDDIIEHYGADTLRMYEMFLGPLEQAKPWDTNGIDGVYKFFRKVWNLFYDLEGGLKITDEAANKDELKILHKTIQKIEHDIEHFSFNTSVSAFMIFVNEISALKSNKKEILEPFLVLLSSFAPHISEELWHALGNKTSIIEASFPTFNEAYLKESDFEYPVSFNGKLRFKLNLSLDIKDPKAIEEIIKNHELSEKWMEGKQIRKVIFVPNKIINIVVG